MLHTGTESKRECQLPKHARGSPARHAAPENEAARRCPRHESSPTVWTANAEIPEPGRKLRCRCNGDCGSSPGTAPFGGASGSLGAPPMLAGVPRKRGSPVKRNAWTNSGSLRRRRFGADGPESNDLIRKRKPPRLAGAAAGVRRAGGPGVSFRRLVPRGPRSRPRGRARHRSRPRSSVQCFQPDRSL